MLVLDLRYVDETVDVVCMMRAFCIYVCTSSWLLVSLDGCCRQLQYIPVTECMRMGWDWLLMDGKVCWFGLFKCSGVLNSRFGGV